MSRAVLLALALAVLAVGCDGPEAAPQDREDDGDVAALESVVLSGDEVPEGLEVTGEGAIPSIQGVLPSRRRDPNLPPLPEGLRGSFVDGYRRTFGGSARAASSTVVRMADAGAASELVAYLRLLPVGGHAATPQEIAATGLGEEGYGWHLLVPENESSGYVWRAGDLVASVTLSGPVGAADPAASLPLAERVDDRLA